MKETLFIASIPKESMKNHPIGNKSFSNVLTPSAFAVKTVFLGFLAVASIPAMLPAAHAQTQQLKTYNIPAGPLSAAIARFSAESGLYIAADGALTAGRTSSAVTGALSAGDALSRLLAGSGIEAVQQGDGRFVLRESIAPASVLPAVRVTAQTETATGKVDGYVAKRSATATKTDSLLIENPQSVSVITADELADRKVETIDEALRYTAGVTPNMKPWAVDEFSLLRGFEIGSAGIFLDGLLTSGRAYAAPIEPYGLERLEVLRGPASVLYGQSPPGGMVNAVSKRPSATPIREIGFEYGTYDRKQIKADFGGALDERGEWLYRLTLLARDSATRLAFDKDDRLYIAPALTWRPNADTQLTLMAHYQKDNQSYAWPNQLQNPGALGQPDPKVNVGGRDNRWERDNKMVGYEFQHRFNDTWSVQQNFRYSEFDRVETNVFQTGLGADGRTPTLFFYPRSSSWWGALVDTKLQGNFQTGVVSHKVLLGVDFSKSKTTDDYPNLVTSIPGFDLFNPVYGGHQTIVPSANPRLELFPSKRTGLYVQDQLKWDRWVVTAGLRHDKADSSNTRVLPAAGTRTQAYDQSDSRTSGRLGAVYLFESGWAPYVSYASSFSPETGQNDVNGNPLKPSIGKQLEAGIRYQPTGSNASYTASVFDLTRTNVRTAAPGDPAAIVQTGEVRSRGLELEGKLEVTRDLSVVAQYTYLDTEITRSNYSDLGLSQSSAPKNSASVWTKYGFNVGDTVKAYSALGVRYIGKARSYQDYDNLNITNPSFTLVDAALGFDQGPWRFSINVNNLLNKQFLLECDGTFCYRNAERTVNISSMYRF